MPSILWVAMATQEGEDGKEAGWYNGLAWDLFVDEAGRDQEVATEMAKAVIAESMERFKGDPAYMLDFYKRKIVSQWSEPTYACQVETNHRWSERSAFMDRLYKGDLWKPFVRVMDVYQSLIYWGALLFLLWMIRKKIPVEKLGLIIVAIGGFIFYIFWEAKSRYVFPYFMMMLPCACCGWDLFVQKLSQWWKKGRTQERVKGLTSHLEGFGGKAILLLAGVPSAFLFLYSLVFTTVYESNDLEVPLQKMDPAPLILLFVAVGLAVLYFAGKQLLKKEENRKRNLNLLLLAVLIHCAVFCTAWNLLAKSALRADPLYIHALAGGFATGDVGRAPWIISIPIPIRQARLCFWSWFTGYSAMRISWLSGP